MSLGDATLADIKIDGEIVAEALRQMPSPQREIIVMHLWGEMTFESIAGVVGGSRASAHRTFQRGIEDLKQRFNPENTEQNAALRA